ASGTTPGAAARRTGGARAGRRGCARGMTAGPRAAAPERGPPAHRRTRASPRNWSPSGRNCTPMSTMREPQDKTSVPCDIDAERRVLGILIKHPHLIDTAVDRLTPAHFFEPQHRAIFEVIYDIYSKGGRVSYTRVYNQLRKEKKLA